MKAAARQRMTVPSTVHRRRQATWSGVYPAGARPAGAVTAPSEYGRTRGWAFEIIGLPQGRFRRLGRLVLPGVTALPVDYASALPPGPLSKLGSSGLNALAGLRGGR